MFVIVSLGSVGVAVFEYIETSTTGYAGTLLLGVSQPTGYEDIRIGEETVA